MKIGKFDNVEECDLCPVIIKKCNLIKCHFAEFSLLICRPCKEKIVRGTHPRLGAHKG